MVQDTGSGIAAEDVQVRNRKMNPYPLDSVLENYGAVESALAGSDYAWMTRDDAAKPNS